MSTDARRRPRGFTLLELAVVLAVLGLLLGMSLTPARMLEERRQLRQETQLLQTAHDAVVGYALQNQTRERVLHIRFKRDGAPDLHDTFPLPSGRPYLPCPDWDGDGYEDRMPEGQNGFIQGVEVNPAITITMTVILKTAESPSATLSHLDWVAGNPGRSTYPYGECMVSRGSLPWRTLGVEPADGWGNRHTYYADRVFSNAIFGFDRKTIADIYDPRIPKTDAIEYSPRVSVNVAEGNHSSGCPAMICDGRRSDECYFPESDFAFEQCAWSATVAIYELKAGAAAREPLNINAVTIYTPGDVTGGLPFVLVAHGPNGRFAVNHWGTMRGRRPICNDWDWTLVPENDSETDPESNGIFHEAMNGARITPDGERCGEADGFSFNHSAFVWEPPRFDEPKGFDDVVMWMTREELAAAMPDGIPPATPMIVSPR